MTLQFDPAYVRTRVALHRLATYVVAPARYRRTERFGLRAYDGGFATPPFDVDGVERRVAVKGGSLIDMFGEEIRTTEITSLSAAAAFLDDPIDPDTAAEHDSPEVGDTDADLEIDEAASLFYGAWFEMAFHALELVRGDAESVDASEPQLWPGHFDPAIEVGDENHRGSYGASPGDAAIDEPYLYLSVWWPDRLGLDLDDPVWNATAFPGRELRLSDFPAGENPVEVAAAFWRESRDLLP